MKKYLKIAIVIIAFVVGFFFGRKTIDVEEEQINGNNDIT